VKFNRNYGGTFYLFDSEDVGSMFPKRRGLSELHGIATEKTVLFTPKIHRRVNSNLNRGAAVVSEQSQSLRTAPPVCGVPTLLSVVFI
jgi:hypothetical protein